MREKLLAAVSGNKAIKMLKESEEEKTMQKSWRKRERLKNKGNQSKGSCWKKEKIAIRGDGKCPDQPAISKFSVF